MVPLNARVVSGPRRGQAPRTVASRSRDSTREIFCAVSASPPCAESEDCDGSALRHLLRAGRAQGQRTACLRSPGAGAQRRQEVRTFGTTTRELLRLVDWLTAAGCTHVALESTGVYWRPVYNLLEGRCELFLVNAQYVKMVPGRKTDVRDSEWLAQLLELGLLRRSFVPPAAPRELRDVVRYRKRLIEDRAREANRVEKVLETANIKLASVVTDVLGVSARAMLTALIAGTGTPEELAELAQRRMRRKRAALGTALTGRVTAHHRFLLAQRRWCAIACRRISKIRTCRASSCRVRAEVALEPQNPCVITTTTIM